MSDENTKSEIIDERNYVKFSKKMKDEGYIILAPDILPIHLEFLNYVFALHGYNLKIAKAEGKQVIETALRAVHNDMCYPALCAIGQQLYTLQNSDYDLNKIALALFQTGGGCRASNYIWLLRKALRDMGLGHIPVLSLSFNGMEKHDGFKLTFKFFLEIFFSFVYADMILQLRNQVLPYEKNKGETDTLKEEWIKKLIEGFKKGKGLTISSMKKNLNKMVVDFSKIEREEKKLIKVGIVGEIYVKYSQFANNGLEKFLLGEGCEVMTPGLFAFFQAQLMDYIYDDKYYRSVSKKQVFAIKCLLKIAKKLEKIMIDAVVKNSSFVPPFNFETTVKKAKEVIDIGVNMGEGWLLTGEIIELIEAGYKNIISVQPFGCLPNHIIAKGATKRIKEKYPLSNIVPIDYDAGASKVNQENRIKLMLSMAEF